MKRAAKVKSSKHRNLEDELNRRGADHAAIAGRAAESPAVLEEVLDGLKDDRARVKYGCQKVLRILGERDPEVLYPEFDRLAGFLASENTFVRWGTTILLGDLAKADREGRFEAIFDRFFAPIPGPEMIAAANTIAAGAKIARAHPHLAGRIAGEILKVQGARYKTRECRNVAIGHAIAALGEFFDLIGRKEEVLEFVKGQLGNSRNATRKKAERFLKKFAG